MQFCRHYKRFKIKISLNKLEEKIIENVLFEINFNEFLVNL